MGARLPRRAAHRSSGARSASWTTAAAGDASGKRGVARVVAVAPARPRRGIRRFHGGHLVRAREVLDEATVLDCPPAVAPGPRVDVPTTAHDLDRLRAFVALQP